MLLLLVLMELVLELQLVMRHIVREQHRMGLEFVVEIRTIGYRMGRLVYR